ncbi:MAG TPA: hypothetical protein VFA04_21535 [Bryobacteraceae bacterium]|nr:hypothetical protein [Bryobacteraceae bacterium]
MAAVAFAPDAILFEPTAGCNAQYSAVHDLLHDLRQPLSSIEAIAYYLEMTIPAQHLEARAMLVKLQEIVAEACGLIDRAEARA